MAGNSFSRHSSRCTPLWWRKFGASKNSFAHRKLWHKYCDEHVNGTRDPRWRSIGAPSLATTTVMMTKHVAKEHAELVEKVKETQRSTEQGRDQWKNHYESYLVDNRPLANPAMHSLASLRQFLDGRWRAVQRTQYKGKHRPV